MYLPKIGWVRLRLSREVVGRIKWATVRRTASGWFVSILAESQQPDPQPVPATAETTVGIDLGLIDFVVLSTGERVPAPRLLRRMEKKLVRAQRILSRREPGSQRRERQRQVVARLHERVAQARADFLHKLSTRLVGENQAIIVEDLSVKGLARTRLAKSIHDAGWGMFLGQLAYKADWAGKVFHQVERFFPSSQIHAVCGTRNAVALSDRTYPCAGCGALVDRDLNAALNIKQHGLLDLISPAGQSGAKARGPQVRPSHPWARRDEARIPRP